MAPPLWCSRSSTPNDVAMPPRSARARSGTGQRGRLWVAPSQALRLISEPLRTTEEAFRQGATILIHEGAAPRWFPRRVDFQTMAVELIDLVLLASEFGFEPNSAGR
jgi:hypothetical protein